MALVELGLSGTNVRDLSPIAGQPLRVLGIEKTEVTHLEPLPMEPVHMLEQDGYLFLRYRLRHHLPRPPSS